MKTKLSLALLFAIIYAGDVNAMEAPQPASVVAFKRTYAKLQSTSKVAIVLGKASGTASLAIKAKVAATAAKDAAIRAQEVTKQTINPMAKIAANDAATEAKKAAKAADIAASKIIIAKEATDNITADAVRAKRTAIEVDIDEEDDDTTAEEEANILIEATNTSINAAYKAYDEANDACIEANQAKRSAQIAADLAAKIILNPGEKQQKCILL